MNRRLGGVACVAAAAACGAHEDVTPAIPVQPGAAARAMALSGHFARSQPPPPGAAAAPLADKPNGSLAFACLAPRGAIGALARVPCEITIGPIGAAVAPPIELTLADGKANVALAPGRYRVTASRGPEYALTQWDAEVLPGKTTWGPNEGATVLRRVVDTRGYLAADLEPADDAASAQESVIADAAEGIELVAGDVASIVQSAKLEDLLQPISIASPDDAGAPAWEDAAAFLERLATKHPATAMAAVDARTYVRVDDDGPLSTWSPAREADFVRGLRDRRDVVLTTGPFVRVIANGAPIGGVARARPDHDVEVKVHVECAPWVSVDRVGIARARGAAVEPQSIELRGGGGDARAADVTFHVRATTDDAFVVTVGDGAAAVRAMTGAIWVDADGDGESLGRTEARR